MFTQCPDDVQQRPAVAALKMLMIMLQGQGHHQQTDRHRKTRLPSLLDRAMRQTSVERVCHALLLEPTALYMSESQHTCTTAPAAVLIDGRLLNEKLPFEIPYPSILDFLKCASMRLYTRCCHLSLWPCTLRVSTITMQPLGQQYAPRPNKYGHMWVHEITCSTLLLQIV